MKVLGAMHQLRELVVAENCRAGVNHVLAELQRQGELKVYYGKLEQQYKYFGAGSVVTESHIKSLREHGGSSTDTGSLVRYLPFMTQDETVSALDECDRQIAILTRQRDELNNNHKVEVQLDPEVANILGY